LKIDFVMKATSKLSNPILICGLPGSALVGKLALDHLAETLPATLLAEVYCGGVTPQVFIEETGDITIAKNEIYFWKSSQSAARDLMLYTGDAQPSDAETEYELSEKIVDFAQGFGAREIITFGAYVTGTQTQDQKVYAAVTHQNLSDRVISIGCKMMNDGAITGMNGLLLGVAKIKGMLGYSLLGETSGYIIDPKASELLLIALSNFAGIKVDTKDLERRAKEAQAIYRTVESWRAQEAQEEERRKPGYIT
jgi:uncharacterized protein (TIGR00162 family)